MKVLYMSISNNYGGAERRLIRIYNGLVKMRNDWKLVLFEKENSATKFCTVENVDQESVVIFNNEKATIHFLKSQKPELLWFFNFDSVICRILLHKNPNTKYLMTIANYYYSTMDFPSWKRKIAFSFVIRRADIVDCLFPSSVTGLKKKYNKENIFSTPVPFTRSELFQPEKKEKTIVFASRLIEDKNINVLLDAVNSIRETIEDYGYQLIICGTGPLEQMVREYIEKHNLQTIVLYIGRVDTKEIFPKSSIFVSIMRGENYPSQSLIEAITSGNYCIVGKGKDTNRIIKPEFGEEIEISASQVADSLKKAIITCDAKQNSIVKDATSFAANTFKYENSLKYFLKLSSI